MNIVDLATDLKNKIEDYNRNKKLEQKAQDLQPIELLWNDLNENINTNIQSFTVLCDRKIAFIPDNLLEKANSVYRSLEDSKLVEIIDLSKNKDLRIINRELQHFDTDLQKELSNAWEAFKTESIRSEPVNIQKGLGDNERVLNEFNKARSEFLKESRNIPSESDKLINCINIMESMSSKMDEIIEKFQMDCPDFMVDFFNQISRGFTLNQLTPEMLTWLKKHGDVDKFEIKKQRDNWSKSYV
jgi:hypothetical protein